MADKAKGTEKKDEAAEKAAGESKWLADYLKTIPEEILSNIFLTPDFAELHYSNDVRGRPELIKLCGLLQERWKTKIVDHTTTEFAIKYRRSSNLVQETADQSAMQREMMGILSDAYKRGASDIHITDMGSYGLLKYRILGEMKQIKDLNAEKAARLITVAFNGLGQQADAPSYSATIRNDARIVSRRYLPQGVHSIRLHSEPIQSDSERQGDFLAMRLLYDATAATGTLEERLACLGFAQPQIATFRQLTSKSGLSIIAGATGHGKSTVLKHIMESMVAEYNDRAYFSVEDPPEYPIFGIHQIQVSTSGREGDSADFSARAQGYTNAIAGAMRSDPDVIMIGEIRYPEAAQTAIDAALTGHAVWATLHASDAFSIVTRLESMLRSLRVANPLDAICDANVLSGLSYQRLVAMLCPKCKRRWAGLPKRERDEAIPLIVQQRLKKVIDASNGRHDIQSVHVRNPGGCQACNGFGLKGRSVSAEVVDVDQTVLDLLHDGKKMEARRRWMAKGNKTYVDSALDLVFSGIADPLVAESRLGVPLTRALEWMPSSQKVAG